MFHCSPRGEKPRSAFCHVCLSRTALLCFECRIREVLPVAVMGCCRRRRRKNEVEEPESDTVELCDCSCSSIGRLAAQRPKGPEKGCAAITFLESSRDQLFPRRPRPLRLPLLCRHQASVSIWNPSMKGDYLSFGNHILQWSIHRLRLSR